MVLNQLEKVLSEIIRKSFKWVIPGLLKTIPNKVLSVKRSLVSEMTTLPTVPQPLPWSSSETLYLRTKVSYNYT